MCRWLVADLLCTVMRYLRPTFLPLATATIRLRIKWGIGDAAADYIFLGSKRLNFALPGTLRPVVFAAFWHGLSADAQPYAHPCYSWQEYRDASHKHPSLNFIFLDLKEEADIEASGILQLLAADTAAALCIYTTEGQPAARIRSFIRRHAALKLPLIICDMSHSTTVDEQLIDFSITSGTLLLDGIGDGVWLMNDPTAMTNTQAAGRTYLEVSNNHQFLNNTAFSIIAGYAAAHL